MRNLLKTIFASIVCYFFMTFNVSAITCEYKDVGLDITYDENSKVTINHEKFQKNQYFQNLLAILKWGSGKYNTEEIEIDQSLFAKYQGHSCPTDMYVCEYGDWSFSLPSITSLGLKIGDLVAQIPCWTGHISESACNYMNEEGWALFTLGEKKLYIYTEEQYENSYLPSYEGGLLSDDLDAAANRWYNTCKGDSDAWYAYAAGGGCWLLGGLLEGVVWETLVGDGIDLLYYRYANCDLVKYSGPHASFNVNCAQLTQKIFKFNEAMANYKKCLESGTSGCVANAISEVKEQEESAKSYCSIILQNYDYAGGQKGCIDACLQLKDQLNELKRGTDLYEDFDSAGKCGFSQRLGTWIVNIFKWVKYILPVIVIVLGILDFIKAIGADKEDEMKKAQKRFIIRLVVAALVFIVPLILEFVLVKMGFGYDSCSLF